MEPAEKGGLHGGIVLHVFDRSIGQHRAAMHDSHAIADQLDELDVVFDHNHRFDGLLGAELMKQVCGAAAFRLSHPRRRFVQQQQRGVVRRTIPISSHCFSP